MLLTLSQDDVAEALKNAGIDYISDRQREIFKSTVCAVFLRSQVSVAKGMAALKQKGADGVEGINMTEETIGSMYRTL